MQVYRIQTIVSPNRVLTLRGVPFRAGEKVEIIILSPPHRREKKERYPLRGKTIRYLKPFDSVAENEWLVLG